MKEWLRPLCDEDMFIYIDLEPGNPPIYEFTVFSGFSGFHSTSWALTTESETARPEFVQAYSLPPLNIDKGGDARFIIGTDNCLYTES